MPTLLVLFTQDEFFGSMGWAVSKEPSLLGERIMNQYAPTGLSGGLPRLLELTETIDDNWLNRESPSIISSKEYDLLLQLFPPLKVIFEKGAEKEPQEFGRTLSHIFRSIAVYNQLKKGSFQQPSLVQEKLGEVYELFSGIQGDSEYLMPLILWLHDIGKMEDRENHTQAGFELVERYELLEPFGLSDEEKILIKKVIQHHLVIGTLYTGEGSFFVFKSILQDGQMQRLLSSSSLGSLWVDFSTMFTIIDLCGYPYNKLTNTHIDSYSHLMGTIKKIFITEDKDSGRRDEKINQISNEMIDWRLCCFLRMFMFLHRTADHTLDNYLRAVQKGASLFLEGQIGPQEWRVFKDKHLLRFSRIQFKYGLAFFCRVGLNNLDQWLNPSVPEEANPQLIRFLVSLDKRIGREEANNQRGEGLWEVSFQNYPKWGEDNKLLQEVLIKPGVVESFVDSGIVRIIPGSSTNTLSLDFKPLLS